MASSTISVWLLVALLLAAAVWLVVFVVPAFGQFGPESPPRSFWDASTVPTGDAESFGVPLEVGLKVMPRNPGSIVGARVYLGDDAGDGHTVGLWTSDGEELARAEIADERPAAWNDVRFPEPVLLEARSTYVVSHFVPSGDSILYAPQYFDTIAKPLQVLTLRALKDTNDEPNGVFHTGSTGFPDSDGRGNNYWVDVLFIDDRAIT